MTDGTKRILIDTDPGIDDSMAILLAFASPEIEVVGLSSVFGNTGGDVTPNALRLVELAGRPDILVARGAEKPLLRPFTGKAGTSTAATASARSSSPSRRFRAR